MKNDIRDAACGGTARRGPAGREDAGLRAGEAAARGALWAQFIIQYSKFRITESGRSLRRACMSGPAERKMRASAGRRPARSWRTGPSCKVSPQPSGRACDVEEQPSARGRLRAARRLRRRICWQVFPPKLGRLRVATPYGRNLKFKIKIQNYEIRLQPAGHASSGTSCGPPPPGGCGPPIAAQLILGKKPSARGGSGQPVLTDRSCHKIC